MSEKKFYITTTLPYVNAKAHMGHAMEFVRADIIARFKEWLGYSVFFNTGTDEHGLKIYRKALEQGKDPQQYVDEVSKLFKDLTQKLGMKSDLNFVRTTDEKHMRAAQEFWRRCEKNGDIYKKNYKILYCVGCELEKTHSDLVEGRCPEHFDRELEEIEEENYFFRFSKYTQNLLEIYKKNPNFVRPDFRLKEISSFVERELEDFSISRLREKQPWGIPVPGDEDHTMYVWFDALVNYVSVIGWPENMDVFDNWWPVTQYAGKDNLRQQSAMWQAMLLSAGLSPSRQIIINGFVISDGQKMSKSIGNVIDPLVLIEEYGLDALRYYIAREIHPFEDSDMTEDKFKNCYNANLANSLGNTLSRVIKMYSSYEVESRDFPSLQEIQKDREVEENFISALNEFNIQKATDYIWKRIANMERFIQDQQPFKTIKTSPAKAKEDVAYLMQELWVVSQLLQPIMPNSAILIEKALRTGLLDSPLFLRK